MIIDPQPRYITLVLIIFVSIASMGLTVGDGNFKCIESERQVLLSFTHDLLDQYGMLSSWRNTNAEDCCNWKGVKCSNLTNQVIELDLHGQHLSGNIDLSVLSGLSDLRYLDLSINAFEGPIPKSMGSFVNLMHLDLYYNQFSGIIPPHLGNLSSLQYLDFGVNHFSGQLPDLSIFPNLKFLDLSFNRLSGNIPIGIGQLSNLMDLNLAKNLFSGVIFPYLGNLSSLQHLNFAENNFSGQLPDLSIFPNLKELYLTFNSFSGNIPIGLGQLSNLETLYLGYNSLEGTIFEAHFLKLRKLKRLGLQDNTFLSFHPHSDWVPPFQLDTLNLRSCKLGPKFPHWFQGQNLSELYISNASISDTVPHWLWNSFPNLEILDISWNEIKGQLPNLSMTSTGRSWTRIFLRANEFEGQIPLLFLQVELLDVSKNKFSGLNFLCEMNNISRLWSLDISDNQFSKQLPNCWANLPNLTFLSLENNGFTGGLPNSMGNLSGLVSLHLDNNNFSGEFPSWLKSFSELQVLDLQDNNLVGEIPAWMGNQLSDLGILSLQANQFYGNLPSTLCHLQKIEVLDLSLNKFNGAIPNCLHNLSVLRNALLSSRWINYQFTDESDQRREIVMAWKGQNQTLTKRTALFLRSIDLSANHLTGTIPTEITSLVGLVSLNLSRNNLTGRIPEDIGQLKSLDFLDFSRNELVGQIPASLSQINGLSILDLSYNKLSGKIPTGTQLQSFNPSAYEGNPELCGPPLPKCKEMDSSSTNKNDEVDENEFATRGFYISVAVGFVVGFLGIFETLMFCRPWRYACFRLFNYLSDWFYVQSTFLKNKVCKLFKD